MAASQRMKTADNYLQKLRRGKGGSNPEPQRERSPADTLILESSFQKCGECLSVVLGHPVCAILLQQTGETHMTIFSNNVLTWPV